MHTGIRRKTGPDDSLLREWNDFYKLHYFRVHTFLKVGQITPTLQLAVMEPKWFDELLKGDPTAIHHERVGDRMVVTAATRELQAFVRKQAQTEGAWGEPTVLQRKEKTSQASAPGPIGKAESASPAERDAVNGYAVNRKVADFPDKEDMSTPEAAYATIQRLRATGDRAFWRRLSAPPLAQQMEGQSGRQEVSVEVAAAFLGTEILEVHLWRKTNAVVLARMPRDIDLRRLCSVDGRWLNDGNDGAPDLEKARDRVAHGRAWRDAEPLRRRRVWLPISILFSFAGVVGSRILGILVYSPGDWQVLFTLKHYMRVCGVGWGGLLEYLFLAVPAAWLLTPRKQAALDLVALTIPLQRAGLARPSLYRVLSPKGNPTFETLRAILEPLGLRMTVTTA